MLKNHFLNFMLSVCIIIGLYPKDAFTIVISDTKFYWLPQQVADLEVTLTPDEDNSDYYLNLVIREIGKETSFWVIRNMGIPSSKDISKPFTINRFFDLSDIQANTNLEYKIVLEPDVITDSSIIDSVGSFIPVQDVLSGVYNVGGFISNEQTDLVEEPTFFVDIPIDTEGSERQKVIREDVPDIEEEPYECGPVSVVRSLRWFHNRGVINLGSKTDRELIEYFKNKSDWIAGKGVTFPGFLSGKLSLISIANLNLINKFNALPEEQQGDYSEFGKKVIDKGDAPTFEFIKKEIDDDEDVEICVRYTDRDKEGHCMTVIGYDVNGNVQQIIVQDDEDQDNPNERNIRRSVDYIDGNPPQLVNLGGNTVNVTSVVSESLLIELVELKAISKKSGINITWLTSAEINNIGFRIWRAIKDEHGKYTNVTLLEEDTFHSNNTLTPIGINKLSKLIYTKGNPLEGASYSYVDNCVKKGETYYYLLEDNEASGKRTFHWNNIVSATAKNEGICNQLQ